MSRFVVRINRHLLSCLLVGVIAVIGSLVGSAPTATAATYTDYYTEMLRGTRNDLYIAEVNGAALLFSEVDPDPNPRRMTVMFMIRWDGVQANAFSLYLRRDGDTLVPTDEPRVIVSGRFEDDQVILQPRPNWLPLPMGYLQTVSFRKSTFDGWLAARDRATEARRIRIAAIATATPRPVGSFGASGTPPLGISVKLSPLSGTQTAMGGKQALYAGAARGGAWIMDDEGLKLRTGLEYVTRSINQPWSYKNPSGPGQRFTALSESDDGQVRVYWRWLQGATLERDGQPTLTLPPGQYALSPDGRWLASYPGIDLNRPAGARSNVSVTRLTVLDTSDGTSREYSGDLRYTAYRGHEDWGYEPPKPQWSPTSSFVVYHDWETDLSFVVNIRSGERTEVGAGTPQWARNDDILLVATDTRARLFDATTGKTVELPEGPPLDSQIYTYYFDASGRFVARSGIALGRGTDIPQTTMFELHTGAELARWQGAVSEGNPEWRSADGPPPLSSISAFGDQPIFAARGYQGCTSLLVHHPLLPGGEICFEIGSLDGRGVWSPDGRYLVSGGYVFDPGHREAVYLSGASSYNVMWSPDSSVLTIADSGPVRIYAPATRELLTVRTSAYPAFWVGRALILNPRTQN